MEYKESPGIAERLTASVPELSRVQETNMDLTANASPTRQHSAASKLPTLMSTRTCPTSQHPASELPTLIPRDSESSTQLVSTEQSPKSKYGNWRRGLEVGTLTTIILTIWMLFSVPTFFYALPPQIRESETSPPGSIDQSVLSCDLMTVYEGQLCLSELTRWQQCFSPQSDGVYLPSDTNQEEAEVTANSLLLSLPLLSPSPECEAAIRPFLCLYLFGSCDSDNQPHRGTQSTCERLRDDVCAQEWTLAETLLGQGVLPNCGNLQQEKECQSIREDENSTFPIMTDSSLTSGAVNSSGIICAEGYYLSNDSLCRPLCSLWVDPPGVGLDTGNTVIIVGAIIALFSSITAIILALTIQKSIMLTFPTIYLIYSCATAAIIALFTLIGYTDREKLFCSSEDLFESFQDETIFCTVAGTIFIYGLAQLGYWVAFHAIVLSWGIVFPFHFRRMKIEEKLKYFHITTILIAFLFPMLPALTHLKDGYIIANTPTIFCLGRSVAVTFFALLLPLSVLTALATSALIIIFWKILKEFVLKKFFDKKQQSVKNRKKQTTPIVKAEAKILFIMCYYITIGTLVLTIHTYYQVAGEAATQAVSRHFACQSIGVQSGRDCGDVPNVFLEVFEAVSDLAVFLIGLLPAVILIFTVNYNCNNKCCKYKK